MPPRDYLEAEEWGERFSQYVPAIQATDDKELWIAATDFREAHGCPLNELQLTWEMVKRRRAE